MAAFADRLARRAAKAETLVVASDGLAVFPGQVDHRFALLYDHRFKRRLNEDMRADDTGVDQPNLDQLLC